MKINRSLRLHVPEFRDFWEAALVYQKSARLPLWPPYPAGLVDNEIQAGLHFSAFLPDDSLTGFFSLALSDPLIWEEKEKGDAIYIHRMCVNPACKGHRLAASALAWAYGYAAGCGRRFIRMDTWADNEKLMEYYAACGFQLVGKRQLGVIPGLSPHYHNVNLAMFENPVGL